MFENALISVNWSGTGVDAAALARVLCVPDARLTLAHVHAEVPLSPDPVVMHLRKFELRQSMRALRGAAYATQVEPTLSVGAPTVSDGLGGLVSMVGADLLVLAPVDRQGPEFAELSHWLARRPLSAPGVIAVAAKGFADAPAIRRIGVISDDSSESSQGLLLARQLAECLGSRLKTFEAPRTRGSALEPRRQAMDAQRLAQFSSGVDLLIAGHGAETLRPQVASALLIVNRPPQSVRVAQVPAALGWPTSTSVG